MKNAIRAMLALLSWCAAVILDAMGGYDSLAGALVAAMCIDYFTGFVCAAVWHKSPKTESGRAQSRAGIKGLFRKTGIVLCIILAARLAELLNTPAIRDSSILFFICNETLSIVENLAIMGVPFPPIITNALDALNNDKHQ